MCPLRAGIFLNLRLQIVHSTGRSGAGVMVEAALLPSALEETADEILDLDDLLRNEA